MEHHWTERLSDYIDGEVDAAERAAIAAHLAGCADCRAIEAGLRRVVAEAAALPAAGPERDLWPDILVRLEPRAGRDAVVVPLHTATAAPRRRRYAFTMPQLAAACLAFVLLGGTAAWVTIRLAGQRGPAAAVAGGEPTAEPAAGAPGVETRFVAATGHDDAVRELEAVLAAARDRLDPTTVAVLERNLAFIDEAIAEARAALARDPGNAYLGRHLDQTLARKIDVLRRATSVARAEI
jgi:anti-sigma factor RsiW